MVPPNTACATIPSSACPPKTDLPGTPARGQVDRRTGWDSIEFVRPIPSLDSPHFAMFCTRKNTSNSHQPNMSAVVGSATALCGKEITTWPETASEQSFQRNCSEQKTESIRDTQLQANCPQILGMAALNCYTPFSFILNRTHSENCEGVSN